MACKNKNSLYNLDYLYDYRDIINFNLVFNKIIKKKEWVIDL